jgi:hypothetical protein
MLRTPQYSASKAKPEAIETGEVFGRLQKLEGRGRAKRGQLAGKASPPRQFEGR